VVLPGREDVRTVVMMRTVPGGRTVITMCAEDQDRTVHCVRSTGTVPLDTAVLTLTTAVSAPAVSAVLTLTVTRRDAMSGSSVATLYHTSAASMSPVLQAITAAVLGCAWQS